MQINTTCNATLDDLRIGGSEVALAGDLTFHQLGLIIAGACSVFAIVISFYLIFMHATHYTKPDEQRHIIRILFMIPVYASASFLSFWFYWHAIYFDVISSCYEAFAIASFFALLCHYIAPNLHEQKNYFRSTQPKPWVLPLNWFAKCCGGQRGIWRTPRSGLTWFNIIWAGIYQYCFIRVTMTITAVVTQYFDRYCESSNSPVFAHIWIEVIEAAAVTVAMYCVIQFYIQLRVDLASQHLLLKVTAIKAVIFLSFWQSFLISILTSSTLNVVHVTSSLAYPDLVVGIPSLLICIEMALFAILHLFAFPWSPYRKGADIPDYPLSPTGSLKKPRMNQGGFLGVKALVDAMNPWDLVKAFARGMRWLFVGVKARQNDPSYAPSFPNQSNENNVALAGTDTGYKGTSPLPIAEEFRRSKFGLPSFGSGKKVDDEGAGLIAHAQPNPQQPYYGDHLTAQSPSPESLRRPALASDIGMAVTGPPEPYHSQFREERTPPPSQHMGGETYREQLRHARRQEPNPSQQWANASPSNQPAQPEIHNALWGQQPQQRPPNQF